MLRTDPENRVAADPPRRRISCVPDGLRADVGLPERGPAPPGWRVPGAELLRLWLSGERR